MVVWVSPGVGMGGRVGVEGMVVRSEGVRVTRLRITSSSAVSGLEAGGRGEVVGGA